MRILVIGAAGSGTSTIAHALGSVLSANVFEADDYFWIQTSPPYTTKREPGERLSLLLRDLGHKRSAIIAGSIVDWGSELENSLTTIIFLTVPAPVRVERLRQRESKLFGSAKEEFLEWAGQYDEGRLPGRSRAKHEKWLAAQRPQIIRIDGDIAVDEVVSRVLTVLEKIPESKLCLTTSSAET